MITTLFKLRDYKESFKFEKEHPKALRWDDKYKLFVLTQTDDVQGIWFKDKTEIVAEMILTWTSKNVANVDSFTVLPSHRGKGLGHQLVKETIDWATEIGFEYITGEARLGPSWKIFKAFGAQEILIYKDWSGTGEDYVSFKIKL